MADLSNFKESIGYKNQLRRMMDMITVERVPREVGTFAYGLSKFGGNYVRLLNTETDEVHFVNSESLTDDRLKYYHMNNAQFYDEIERIGYTPFF
jgi:hypothetical protein